MKVSYLESEGMQIPYYRASAFIIGSGAAGYNAADSLYDLGMTDIAIVTEGRMMGTSRNTGSDKQTYYKLSMTGNIPDSVYDMAKSLMRGGAMHGDLALSDAALSARCFFKLVNLGVPFPMNEFGEYVGYQTDHDETKRATSCGPLTSKYMTEALEKEVQRKQIPLFDGHRVIKLLASEGELSGFLTICKEQITKKNPLGLTYFSAGAVVYAVGGASAIYADTVYPPSQTSALGAAFSAGAAGANLTESQYGLASVKFRWNLSGTYQQVLPCYVSTDENGEDAREFLQDAFDTEEEMLHAVFSKGYEWPFDPKKTGKGASSRVDLAVFCEKQKGRRVFLDYRKNPSALMKNQVFAPENIPEKAKNYLMNSNALLETPFERLLKMNPLAIDLYHSHGIDLASEPLEIAVSAQHGNGGLAVDVHRESISLKGLYAVGECAGTFGVYRPGGSALNATQTGSLMAAMEIAYQKKPAPAITDAVMEQIRKEIQLLDSLHGSVTRDEVLQKRYRLGRRMSDSAAFLRDHKKIKLAMEELKSELSHFASEYAVCDNDALRDALINRDILETQYVFLSAMDAYIEDGGKSRGSYLILDGTEENLLAVQAEIDTAHTDFVQITHCLHGRACSSFEPVRPIPESEQWFETVWNQFRNRLS